MALTVIAAYDVVEDGRRGRLAAVLAGYGVRLQKSVFECVLPEGGTAELLAAAERIINPRTDRFVVIPVCATCAEGRASLGQYLEVMEDPFWIF